MLKYNFFLDPLFVYQKILVFISVSLILSSFEDIKNKQIFLSKGLLSFDVSRLSQFWTAKTKAGKILKYFLEERKFLVLLILNIIGSISLFFLSLFYIFSPILLALLLFINVLITLRNPYGLDGAHQMQFIVLMGACVMSFQKISPQIPYICLYFIASQLVLSYSIAGLGKVISPLWRRSHALLLVYSTQSYGNEFLFNKLKNHRNLTTYLSWFVMLFELSFILVLFLPLNLGIFMCILGIIFHFFNAVIMGLNNFLFSFLSAYPALIFCIYQIHG